MFRCLETTALAHDNDRKHYLRPEAGLSIALRGQFSAQCYPASQSLISFADLRTDRLHGQQLLFNRRGAFQQLEHRLHNRLARSSGGLHVEYI